APAGTLPRLRAGNRTAKTAAVDARASAESRESGGGWSIVDGREATGDRRCVRLSTVDPGPLTIDYLGTRTARPISPLRRHPRACTLLTSACFFLNTNDDTPYHPIFGGLGIRGCARRLLCVRRDGSSVAPGCRAPAGKDRSHQQERGRRTAIRAEDADF